MRSNVGELISFAKRTIAFRMLNAARDRKVNRRALNLE
jgi:hypothetical protein